MFEKFAGRARRALFFARYEASKLGSKVIESEHILLGILREGEETVSEIFHNFKVKPEDIRREIEGDRVYVERISSTAELPLSEESKKILAYASNEAESMFHATVGSEHMLIGILRVEGCSAMRILAQRGLDVYTVREEVLAITKKHESAAPAPTAPITPPTMQRRPGPRGSGAGKAQTVTDQRAEQTATETGVSDVQTQKPAVPGQLITEQSASAAEESLPLESAAPALGLVTESTTAAILVASVSDLPATEDHLGFPPYVMALAGFLASEKTQPPLTLSIEGTWGSGKSSFMMQLKQALRNGQGLMTSMQNAAAGTQRVSKRDRARPQCLTVWFNAWRHDKEEALWAAFALDFIRQVSRQLPFHRRLLSGCRLFLSRYRWWVGWLELVRAVAIWLVLAVLCLGLPVAIIASHRVGTAIEQLGHDWLTEASRAARSTGERSEERRVGKECRS